MKIRHVLTPLVSIVFAWYSPTSAAGEIRLPSIIGDNMVLQQKQHLPIWGWADPGEKVTVAIGNHHASAKAGTDGMWRVKLAPMKAQPEPQVMTITGKNGAKIEVKNILIGEVWLGSGQSNMEWPLRGSINGNDWVAGANRPKMRLFLVPHALSATPVADVAAKWVECNPETVKDFSAVLYQFGRNLNEELAVPVGLIESNWGGCNIRAWIPPEGFASQPELRGYSEWIDWANETRETALSLSLDKFDPFLATMKQAATDIKAKPFWDKKTDDDFRRSILDAHTMFVSWLETARKAAAEKKTVPEVPHPLITCHIYNPTLLYNAMIHPLVPFGIRGAIWYQGETDCGARMLYAYQMSGLIQGWRKVWNQGNFPFGYVQIAPYDYVKLNPICTPEDLPLFWEAQTAALAVPNTGMVVTHDIGSFDNIHPPNKHDVGRRLALWALAKTYGRKELVYSGPLYDSYKVEGRKIRIRFKHTGSGLTTKDGKAPNWFTIAGEDGKFVDATAVIEGDSVVVSNPDVPTPMNVRFGWDQSADPNLANREGLPASSFRTDR